VAAGEKNIMPLLMAMIDRYHHLSSNTERAAFAREMLSRGGPELAAFLSMGAEGIRKFTEHAKELGLIVGKDDVTAFYEYKAAAKEAKNQQEALDFQIGQKTLPLLMGLKLGWAGFIELMTSKKSMSLPEMLLTWAANVAAMKKEVADLAKTMAATEGDGSGLPTGDSGVAKEKKDYDGLASILETVKERIAGATGEYARNAEEIAHLHVEVAKATAEFEKLRNAGELTPAAVKQGLAALQQLPVEIFSLSAALAAKMATESKEHLDKWRADFEAAVRDGAKSVNEAFDAIAQSSVDLQKRIDAQSEKSFAQQLREWDDEVEALRSQLRKKGELTEQNVNLLAQLQRAGADKITRDQKIAYASEITRVHEHLTQILEANMDEEDKLKAQYNRDVEEYGKAQMEKTILAAGGEEHRAEIEAQFAKIQSALLQRYQADLQTLRNSQGWQGVLGSQFASLIKNDEQLWKQWASSVNQSHLMVKDSLAALKTMSEETFRSFAQGEAQAIASSIMYAKSIGAAMEAALAATLESLAARALVQAIYALGLGFLDLAEQNYPGAEAAFTAAAIFGSIGIGAAIAGRALTPSQASASSAGGPGTPAGYPGSTSVSSSGSGGAYGNGGGSGQQQPHVTVNVYGHVVGTSGIAELTGMINDAVLNQDVQLTSTNTRTGAQVTR